MAERSRADTSIDRWFKAFIAVGLLLRTVTYLMHEPVWGDEASIGLNVINRGFRELLQPLNYAQVAPLGFLWVQRWVYLHLGMSEWAMRLAPFLAGLTGFLLFACWVRLLAGPRAAALAVGIMAVGNYSVRHAVELKPYGFDLCAAMLLLLPITLYLLRQQPRWLVATALITPIALAMSYPAIFVAGGIALTLLGRIRRMRRRDWAAFVLFGAVLLACFAVLVLHVAGEQYRGTQAAMTAYWQDAFPPRQPLKFIAWFLRIHAGNMFSYPFGGKNGGSTASFALFVIGLAAWRQFGKPGLMPLLLWPFALTFVAAAMHRYPYGESARVSQHLAPAIILLIGIGAARIVTIGPPGWMTAACGFLLLFGAGLLVMTIVHPYKAKTDWQARQLVREAFHDAGPEGVVAVLQPPEQVNVTFQWYLRQHDGQTVWNAMKKNDWQRHDGPICVVNLTPGVVSEQMLQREIGRPVLQHRATRVYLAQWERWETFCFPGK